MKLWKKPGKCLSTWAWPNNSRMHGDADADKTELNALSKYFSVLVQVILYESCLGGSILK